MRAMQPKKCRRLVSGIELSCGGSQTRNMRWRAADFIEHCRHGAQQACSSDNVFTGDAWAIPILAAMIAEFILRRRLACRFASFVWQQAWSGVALVGELSASGLAQHRRRLAAKTANAVNVEIIRMQAFCIMMIMLARGRLTGQDHAAIPTASARLAPMPYIPSPLRGSCSLLQDIKRNRHGHPWPAEQLDDRREIAGLCEYVLALNHQQPGGVDREIGD